MVPRLADFVDHRYVRIALGAFLGLPVTVAALCASVDAIAMGPAALASGGVNPSVAAAVTIVTAACFLGICGAWRRLLTPHSRMTEKQRQTVRRMIGAGVVGAMPVAACVFWLSRGEITLVLAAAGIVVLGLVGLALLAATPSGIAC
jgi:predicted DNA repair protein MutK